MRVSSTDLNKRRQNNNNKKEETLAFFVDCVAHLLSSSHFVSNI